MIKNWNVDGLIISLEEASLDCFDKTLSEVLSEFSDGRSIEWKSRHKMKESKLLKKKKVFHLIDKIRFRYYIVKIKIIIYGDLYE